VEGKRSRWGGWPSKPERVARRLLVGSTPTLFRQPRGNILQAISIPRGRRILAASGIPFAGTILVER
jgi:hypothetical protein